MVEVFAKAAGFDESTQITIRRSNDPHVHRDGFGSTHTLKFPLLKESKELGLDLLRDVTHLIKKYRATVSHFHFPLFELMGSRKGSFFMTKKLALQKLFR